MKRIICLAVLLLSAVVFAAAPSAPTGANVVGVVTPPSTNAIHSVQGFFPTAIVYGPTNIFTPANSVIFKWSPNTETDLASYNVYFGDMTTTKAFGKFSVPKAVTAVIFTGLNTSVPFGFYATAVNTANLESSPSTLVVIKPGTP